ncbi:hypothetical protein BZA05DRAFT_263257 [Tricharina praecox]|uniref:uncharacterized protein n=1 Tax=Tricharina praecox TaxID=43433 RepID=UPI0022211F3C|nr:uncharacterized protein BZA05DRAFT_263257 [Tricharina praecox]KAI5854337.1 hypothetical protein BZA05DRAFT_263257 [Tricharina praecox]
MKSSVPSTATITESPRSSRSGIPPTSTSAGGSSPRITTTAQIMSQSTGYTGGGGGGLPFPMFPLQLRGAKIGGGGGSRMGSESPVRESGEGKEGREGRCCGHDAELAEERARRRRAERKVKELEAMLRVVMKGMQSINEEGEDVVVVSTPRDAPLREALPTPSRARAPESERQRLVRDSKPREREGYVQAPVQVQLHVPDRRSSTGRGRSAGVGDQLGGSGSSRPPLSPSSPQGARYSIGRVEYP